MSPDTIVPQPGDPQSLNRYAYVRNNPLRYTDPTGHAQACAEGDLGGGCGWDRTVYTHSSVQFPLAGLDDRDREFIQSGQAIAETQEMLDATASVSVRGAKSITKQVVGVQIARALPASGAASVGACGTFGVGGYGTACLVFGAADSNGNVVILGGSVGGGGTFATASLTGNVTWLPGANDVSQLAGPMINTGVSAGAGIVGGIDWVVSKDADGKPLHGFAVNAGFGAKDTAIVLPAEFHGGVTTTGFTPWRFNVWKPYQALFGNW